MPRLRRTRHPARRPSLAAPARRSNPCAPTRKGTGRTSRTLLLCRYTAHPGLGVTPSSQYHTSKMQVLVRYWLSNPPVPYGGHRRDDAAWLDHSVHPATRIGLRNAVLAAEDRLAALRQLHPGEAHGCVIFLAEDEESQVLSIHEADILSEMVEHGEFTWETLRTLVATQHRSTPAPGDGAPPQQDDAEKPADTRLSAYAGESPGAGLHRLDVDV